MIDVFQTVLPSIRYGEWRLNGNTLAAEIKGIRTEG